MRFLGLFIFAFVTVAFVSAATSRAQIWTNKEEAIAKELYIPEIKVADRGAMPSALARHLENLGVEIVYVERRVDPGKYSCTPILKEDLSRALNALGGALTKIPESTISKVQLKYLMLCDEAFAQGAPIGGIPVPPLKVLMLSMGGAKSAYQEHIFFHELYHYLEYVSSRSTVDAKWNETYSGYGSNTSEWTLGSGSKDFVSAYAQTKPEEDRAEIFAHMMRDPNGFDRYVEMQQSDVLAQKAAYIRNKAINEFGIDSLKR